MKITRIIIFTLIFILSSNKAKASPPTYVTNPDCIVSGIIKNIEFKKNNCDKHCQECKNPDYHGLDCDWIPPEEEYFTTIKILKSIDKQSLKDNQSCNGLYPPNEEHLFLISVDLFKKFQPKKEDIISGNVLPSGEFSSLQKNELHLSSSFYYFILRNIYLFIVGLISIVFIIIFIIFRRFVRNN